MGALVCTWVLVVTLLCGVSHGYFASNTRSCSFPGPQYSSCRETIEDLKALLELLQCFKPDATYTCPTCTSTLSEELIIKLVNALIYAATQNCGFNGKGGGGIPIHYGGGVGGNTAVSSSSGNVGRVIGSGNNVIGGGVGIANGGDIINGGGNNFGNAGVIDNNGGYPAGSIGGSTVGGYGSRSAEKKPMGAPSTSGQSSNDNNLLSVDLGNSQLIGVDLGPNQNSGGTSTYQKSGGASKPDNQILAVDLGNSQLLGVNLGPNQNSGGPSTNQKSGGASTPDNQILGIDLGKNQLLGVDLGTNRNTGAVTPVSAGGSQKPGGVTNAPGNVTNGAPGSVTTGAPGAVTTGAPGAVTTGAPGAVTAGAPGAVTTGAPGAVTTGAPGAVTEGAPGVVTNGVPGTSSPVNPGTATPSVPSNGKNTPINNVNSGNTQIDQNSLNLVNVLSPPTNIIK